MISHAHRCIFVHVPRSGGTSIEDAIWPGSRTVDDLWMGFISTFHNPYHTGGLQHLPAKMLREVVGADIFEEYFKFSFIRNPWDKAVSQYCYMRRRPDLRALIGMDEHDDFKTYLRLIRTAAHVQWEPQHAILCDDAGKLLVDDLGRYETFAIDVARMLARLDMTAPLSHANRSERAPLDHYYDSEAIDMVAEMYAEDIRLFGYAPPDALITRGEKPLRRDNVIQREIRLLNGERQIPPRHPD
jgi:hypothetical protein